MTAGDSVGNDLDNDMGDGYYGGDSTGANPGKGDDRDAGREGEGAPGEGHGCGGGGNSSGGNSHSSSCILQGSYAFFCEDIFTWRN